MNKRKILDKDVYQLLDVLKILCAYLVIGIHTRPFQSISITLDKVFYYNISNYAVPFFYACTGYFLIIKQPEKNLHIKLAYRIKKVAKIYLIWSVIYLPLTICGWFVEGNQSLQYVFFCIRNYILVGDNFYSWTLWYLNGLIFALIFIDFFLKKISFEQLVKLGSVVYLIGVILTALGGHQDELPSILSIPVNVYFSIFATTRNGLFQSLAFILIGMYIANKEKSGELKEILHKGKALILIYLIKIPVSLVGGGQYLSQMLDLPISYVLFGLIIYECHRIKLKGGFYKKLRSTSEMIYLIHMYLVALCAVVLYKENYCNFKSFFICAGISTLIAIVFSFIKERKICNQ